MLLVFGPIKLSSVLVMILFLKKQLFLEKSASVIRSYVVRREAAVVTCISEVYTYKSYLIDHAIITFSKNIQVLS